LIPEPWKGVQKTVSNKYFWETNK